MKSERSASSSRGLRACSTGQSLDRRYSRSRAAVLFSSAYRCLLLLLLLPPPPPLEMCRSAESLRAPGAGLPRPVSCTREIDLRSSRAPHLACSAAAYAMAAALLGLRRTLVRALAPPCRRLSAAGRRKPPAPASADAADGDAAQRRIRNFAILAHIGSCRAASQAEAPSRRRGARAAKRVTMCASERIRSRQVDPG